MNKEQIVALLKTDDRAIVRALLVLNANQTATEQSSEQTINRNGEGFRPCHARMGTSMAKFFKARGYLSPKQIAYWRKPMKNAEMKIAIYWRQLAEAAAAKAAAKPQAIQAVKSTANDEPPAPSVNEPNRAREFKAAAPGKIGLTPRQADLGNLLEERMVLQEQVSNPEFAYLVKGLQARLDAVNVMIDEVRNS